MKTAGIVSALFAVTAALVGGCGVGTYHTPDVAPVVMPEPEEDIFADLDFDSEEASSTEGEEPTPEEEAEPAAEEKPADASEAPSEGKAEPAGDKAAKPATDDKSGAKKKK